MKHGFIYLWVDKIVMFGIARSGKTCSLRALLPPDDPPDQDPNQPNENPPKQGSTPLMERPITVMMITSDDGKQWKRMTREEVHERIAQIIKSRPMASSISEHLSQSIRRTGCTSLILVASMNSMRCCQYSSMVHEISSMSLSLVTHWINHPRFPTVTAVVNHCVNHTPHS